MDMNELSQSILNVGVAASVAGAFLWLVIHLVTKTLPSMWEQMRADRASDQKMFTDVINRMDSRAQATCDAVCSQIAGLTAQIMELTKEMRHLTARVDVLDSRRHGGHPQTQVDFESWRRPQESDK